MKCPFCAHEESKVTDSRASASGDAIRRRRECEGCARRFTTYEHVDEIQPTVVKKDGRREAFDRKKIAGGFRRACEKRPVPVEQIDREVSAIERELIELGEREVPSSVIGERVMAALRRTDDIAYVRFASVYRQFQDLAEFKSELDALVRQKQAIDAKGTGS